MREQQRAAAHTDGEQSMPNDPYGPDDPYHVTLPNSNLHFNNTFDNAVIPPGTSALQADIIRAVENTIPPPFLTKLEAAAVEAEHNLEALFGSHNVTLNVHFDFTDLGDPMNNPVGHNSANGPLKTYDELKSYLTTYA